MSASNLIAVHLIFVQPVPKWLIIVHKSTHINMRYDFDANSTNDYMAKEHIVTRTKVDHKVLPGRLVAVKRRALGTGRSWSLEPVCKSRHQSAPRKT